MHFVIYSHSWHLESSQKELQSWPKVLGHWYFPIQKCIRGTKHLTVHPSPPLPPPHPNNVDSVKPKCYPVDFNIFGWGRWGLSVKIFFRLFAFLWWWHYFVWMCSVPRTFGHDCSFKRTFQNTTCTLITKFTRRVHVAIITINQEGDIYNWMRKSCLYKILISYTPSLYYTSLKITLNKSITNYINSRMTQW